MSNVAKGWAIGDTVYVHFKDNNTLNKIPQTRVVADCRVISSGNVAEVTFTTGEKVLDGASTAQRVFTTSILCANAIIDAVISDYAACAVAGNTGTNSGVSTAGAATIGLVRLSA